ncbi:MAG TPA: iron-containing alcohol dehydrogenase [Vineibacter sp.]|nr:iron-containing alcohol dehydrogenase [Vineibacter sp.]
MAETHGPQWTRLVGEYVFPPMEKVVYGKPAAAAVVEEADRLRRERVFLVVSNTLNRTTDEIAAIRRALGERYVGLYDRVPPHTTRISVIEAADAARQAGADLIVAIGGGSVVDAGKAMLVCLEQDITDPAAMDDLVTRIGPDGKPLRPQITAPSTPLVVVPSTLSGGEYNAGTLVTDSQRKLKQILFHPLMMPKSILLDPRLTLHTPALIWFGSGLRAMDHGIEALCSLKGTPLTDGAVLHGIRLLREGLLETKTNAGDLDARAKCMTGSWLAAFGLQARVPMGASHAIGHILGGTCDVPHYFCTPVMMPSVLRFNRPVTDVAQARLADALGQPGADAADVFAELVAALGLPRSLRDVGVGANRFPLIAEIAMKHIFTTTNPRPIRSPDDVEQILALAA